MADHLTTSSESIRHKISPIINTKETTTNHIEINNPKIEPSTMMTLNTDESQTNMTNLKDNNRNEATTSQTITQSAETNIRRLIQNKLKRKKKLAPGQGSVEEISASNTKKRKTKVEAQNGDSKTVSSCDSSNQVVCSSPVGLTESEKRVVSKPPLPPKSDRLLLQGRTVPPTPPPPMRLRRKLEDNSLTIQKLNARAEQLRLEIIELRTSLASERSAVRTLRAQNEAESRKSRTEVKKLQTVLDATKKVVKKKSKDESASTGKENGSNADLGKLSQELRALKDANRALEEKIQKANEAERRKASDIRSIKDSYEIRLTQISKSAKTEINRLLEEIKTKERNIGQLKKEIHSLKSVTNKKDLRNAQHPPEMKKLKEIERTESSTESSNQKSISTTCGENEYNSMPHEITQRILEAHDDLNIFRNKDHTNSDTDSALSSAPPSISPQPPNSDTETSDIWQSVKNYSKELSNLQSYNESLHNENQSLKKELELAKQQIEELEKVAIEARKENAKMQQMKERIKYLEEREGTLENEVHELREQNELLEFRIIELEECNDKWSLRSNLTPDTRDMWTDTEKECDDLSLYPDRSDSGITSPHCQHHIEDERTSELPYDLTVLNPISNDELKRRVVAMTKRINCDEYDKVCLLQILSLLNNLDILSQDTSLISEDAVPVDTVKAGLTKSSDYISATSTPRSFAPGDHQSLISTANAKLRNGKIVATVLPYTTTLSSPSDSPRKFRSWQTSSLQESGVFEGDLADTSTQWTQTEPNDFPCPPTTELCAEIQKLNKFREKIEECVSKAPVPAILSPNLSDQRKLQYYKDRLEVLEKKLVVYESSGDQQAKKLAERLQREVQLEALVKDYSQQIDYLETENSRLEEERCEFEEAENDTRLKLQRLEVELEILSQRNLELEMSKEAAQTKLQESRQKCAVLQDSVVVTQERVGRLETQEKEYKNSMNLIKTAMPAILLFNSFIVNGYQNDQDQVDLATSNLRRCTCHEAENNAIEARVKLQQLMARERELTQNITELNRAYNETLESADNLWAQMEKDYKDRLEKAKQTECLLKARVVKLEERIAADSQSAVERLSYLEENESCYKNRICKLNKENKDLAHRNESLQNDYQRIKNEYVELKNYLDVVAQPNLEREKQKVRKLEEDIATLTKTLKDVDEAHEQDMQYIRSQLNKSNKELLHIEVTNSELKEEVCTLETRICELVEQHCRDEEKVRNLTDELRSALEDRHVPYKRQAGDAPNLAEELAPSKRINIENVKDLTDAAERLSEAIAYTEQCKNCTPGNEDITELAKEIKKLADMLLNRKGETSSGGDDSPDQDLPPGTRDRKASADSQKSLMSRNPEDIEESKAAEDTLETDQTDLAELESINTSSLNVVPVEVGLKGPGQEQSEEEGENEPKSAEKEKTEDEIDLDAVVMHMQMKSLNFPTSFGPEYLFKKTDSLKKMKHKVAAEVPSEMRKINFPFNDISKPLKSAVKSSASDHGLGLTDSTKNLIAAFGETLNFNLQISNNDSLSTARSETPVQTPRSTDRRDLKAIDRLMSLVAESVASTEQTREVERSLRQLFASDVVFRQNLNLALRLGRDEVETPAGSVRSFEQISRAMECIRTIEALYDPISVPAIESLRSVILDKLLQYFMKSPEKLRCVVCVPKERSK